MKMRYTREMVKIKAQVKNQSSSQEYLYSWFSISLVPSARVQVSAYVFPVLIGYRIALVVVLASQVLQPFALQPLQSSSSDSRTVILAPALPPVTFSVSPAIISVPKSTNQCPGDSCSINTGLTPGLKLIGSVDLGCGVDCQSRGAVPPQPGPGWYPEVCQSAST